MKILLIEDDDSQRMLLRHIVEKKILGKIYEAKNGIEGLRLTKFHSPDLILLDIWMPIMNGLEMLEKLRQDEMYKSIPVVIITGLGDKETIQRAVTQKVIGYILKPFTADQIDSVLSKFALSYRAEAI